MKKIAWSEPARADIPRLDRHTAMRILAGLHHFAETGQGDIKRLKGEPGELRLRVGDYRDRSLAPSPWRDAADLPRRLLSSARGSPPIPPLQGERPTPLTPVFLHFRAKKLHFGGILLTFMNRV